jgi:hypothetical protein
LLGKQTDAETARLIVPGRELPEAIQEIVSPAGNRLSTTARVEQKPGQAACALGDITRTVTGAQPSTLNAPSDEVRKLMPNLMHMANDMPDVQASIQRIVEDNPDMVKRWTQGPISHDELKAMAADLGMTADDFLKTPVGKAFNPEEQLALRSAVVSRRTRKLAQRVQERAARASDAGRRPTSWRPRWTPIAWCRSVAAARARSSAVEPAEDQRRSRPRGSVAGMNQAPRQPSKRPAKGDRSPP